MPDGCSTYDRVIRLRHSLPTVTPRCPQPMLWSSLAHRALRAFDLYAQRADVVHVKRTLSDPQVITLQQRHALGTSQLTVLRPHVSEALHVSDCGIDSSMLASAARKGYEILSSASAFRIKRD
jgi:hypothetical protein